VIRCLSIGFPNTKFLIGILISTSRALVTILVVWLPELGGVDVDIAAHENDFQGSIEVASHPSPHAELHEASLSISSPRATDLPSGVC
jgi:hypothetical protein